MIFLIHFREDHFFYVIFIYDLLRISIDHIEKIFTNWIVKIFSEVEFLIKLSEPPASSCAVSQDYGPQRDS